MASLISQATALALRLSGMPRKFASETALAKQVIRDRAKEPARPSRSMQRRFDITLQQRHGHEVYTVKPKAKQSAGTVIYLHGGAYVADIVQEHWRFIARMADRLGMTFIVPLYPLAPENECLGVISFVLGVYRDVLASQDPSRPILMGDSAGGGLALSLAMQVVSTELPKPAGLVLISPWLDVTMTAAMQEEIEKVDPMLMRPGVRAAGLWYAGALSAKDPRVSPLFGELVGLPPILMFCGTHDILVADARRLALRAEVEGADVEYQEEPRLMHVYPLLLFPESRKAQEEIERFISKITA